MNSLTTKGSAAVLFLVMASTVLAFSVPRELFELSSAELADIEARACPDPKRPLPRAVRAYETSANEDGEAISWVRCEPASLDAGDPEHAVVTTCLRRSGNWTCQLDEWGVALYRRGEWDEISLHSVTAVEALRIVAALDKFARDGKKVRGKDLNDIGYIKALSTGDRSNPGNIAVYTKPHGIQYVVSPIAEDPGFRVVEMQLVDF